jgi:DNA-binding response OmpR family regulator
MENKTPETAAEVNAAAPKVPSAKNVLVIEDDLMLASIIVRHLTTAGMNATLITAGDQAYPAVKNLKPDCIVLDIFLPGMNGLDILQEIRKDDETKDVKVVVVSNTDQKNDRARATLLGADFMLKAAVTPQEIVAQVVGMLK